MFCWVSVCTVYQQLLWVTQSTKEWKNKQKKVKVVLFCCRINFCWCVKPARKCVSHPEHNNFTAKILGHCFLWTDQPRVCCYDFVIYNWLALEETICRSALVIRNWKLEIRTDPWESRLVEVECLCPVKVYKNPPSDIILAILNKDLNRQDV